MTRPRLAAKPPCAGLLPVSVGGLTLQEAPPEAITWVAPLAAQAELVDAQLTEQIGAGLPRVGQAQTCPASQVLWFGPGQALVLGPAVAPDGAAVADQSDAWAVLSLSGPLWAEALARVTPLDLRPSRFPTGSCAQSLLGHMSCLFHRAGPEAMQMLVFRSMARSAVHEIERAMQAVR